MERRAAGEAVSSPLGIQRVPTGSGVPFFKDAVSFSYFSSSFVARAYTLSALKPSSFSTVGPGADAPKRSSPITSPCRPTHFHQPSGAPASTASFGR